VSADAHLALCESIARETRGMRAAAERGDWEQLVERGDACAALVERMRAHPAPQLDAEARERKARLLREMLADDREIRHHTEPELSRIGALLGVGRRAATAAARYQE
jgi:flagellar protein FliT